MPFRAARPLVRLLAPLLLAAAAVAAEPAPAGQPPRITAEESTFDAATGLLVFRGGARAEYGDLILTADEMRYDRARGAVLARGRFVITNAGRRLVADEGSYELATRRLQVRNLRVGEFPIYLSGESVEGTLDELVFTNATIFFREDAAYAPSIKAKRVVYQKGRIVAGEGLEVGLLGRHLFSLPTFQHDLRTELISYFTAKAGYRRSLGVFGEAGLRLPPLRGVRLGADAGLYTARGLMAGPAGDYSVNGPDGWIRGSFSSGYINDHGDRLTDILGRPVEEDRSFVQAWHQQQVGERVTLGGQFTYWSDSEVLRDFRPKAFFPVQQPDSFLEAAYRGPGFVLSAFTRLHPNRYHRMVERLPEIRLDVPPDTLPGGFVQRLHAGVAVLEVDPYLAEAGRRTTRLDAHYGLQRPLAPTPWLTVTPVAGLRWTRYTDAVGGGDFTREVGEIGFDARLRASATFDHRDEIWEIDGLRHLVEPRLSYRYAPRAGDGRGVIPRLDRRTFSTYLQPLGLADRRDIDDWERLDTLRAAVHQTLQTRDPAYGSRDLARLVVAADHRFARSPGQRPWSDLHTELSLSPAPWLRLEAYQRTALRDSTQQELNYAVELVDQDWWSVRLGSHYLRGDYQEYALDYRQRLSEVLDVVGRWRYDVRRSRFNEQTYGVWHRLGQTWAVKYEASFYEGPRRESSFGFNVEVELLRF